MNNTVRALTVYNGELIAGGEFSTADRVSASCVARWDGSSWNSLDSGLDSNAVIFALTVYNGELVAGGHFTAVGEVAANFIARWDGTSWNALGSGMAIDFKFAAPLVAALTVFDGELIAGGFFTSAGGVGAAGIARWDGTSWHPLGSGMADFKFAAPSVRALMVHHGELIAGGNFDTAGGVSAKNIARWDGTSWHPLGSGMDSYVYALTGSNDELIAGGSFTIVGDQVSGYWARWATGAASPADLDCDGDVDGFDLGLLLGQWTGAASYAPCPPHAPADLNADCKVNGFDLSLVLAAWG
jgi:hypothetical protein